MLRSLVATGLTCLFFVHGTTHFVLAADKQRASEPANRTRRVLLIGQGPDGHPFSTHEYMGGVTVLARLLQPVKQLQTLIVQADGSWDAGPELLDTADGVVLFVSQGAHWIREDAQRLRAFQRLAARQGGCVCLHWGMGSRSAENIKDFVQLFGGCHGGPDRKYKVVQSRARVSPRHPIMQGLADFDVQDEFYYTLKFAKTPAITPVLTVTIDSNPHTVAWAWQRANGGRSFGFSGCHFHRNWSLPQYRRMMAQAVLWSLKVPIPESFAVDVPPETLRLTPRPQSP